MMNNPTKKEVADAIHELHEAMIESIEAGKAEQDAKIIKQKAHCRLLLAKDKVRELSFNE